MIAIIERISVGALLAVALAALIFLGMIHECTPAVIGGVMLRAECPR